MRGRAHKAVVMPARFHHCVAHIPLTVILHPRPAVRAVNAVVTENLSCFDFDLKTEYLCYVRNCGGVFEAVALFKREERRGVGGYIGCNGDSVR